jgi:hypothetical protein
VLMKIDDPLHWGLSEKLLRKHLANFTRGDVQLFERLDNDLDRAVFMAFFDKGVHASACRKVEAGLELTGEETDFCKFMRQFFNGDSPEESLKRKCHIDLVAWAKVNLTREETDRLKSSLVKELFGLEFETRF